MTSSIYLFDQLYLDMTRGGRAGADPYAILGFKPKLVTDFKSSTYRVGGAASTFGDALTFSRSGSATYVDATGTLQTAAAGVPRLGHHVWDGSEWVNEGLLIESEARTNLLLNSDTIATQDATVTAVPHTLHFTGTGTVTLSGAFSGSLVGTGTGEQNRVSLTFTPTAGTLTVTVSGTVTNAQLEAGSTPSSYIPTAGSTVTRAAETLTIPAANLPWPEPKVIGPELVTNGTFDTDTNWNKGPGVSITGGALVFSGLASNTTQSAVATLARGSFVRVSYEVTSFTTGQIQIFFQQTSPTVITIFGVSSNSLGVKTGLVFVPENATTFGFNTNNFVGSVDNISVREIDPLAVSIQMDGRMTYADEETDSTIVFSQWFLASNNFIRSRLRTDGAFTGAPQFLQIASGVSDQVTETSPGTYSPGTLVPYNIASRHGSTFINGAVDGTALTADTTPVALPDLSATDLNLAFDYMGTVGRFVMWDEDLTDEGIAEASA